MENLTNHVKKLDNILKSVFTAFVVFVIVAVVFAVLAFFVDISLLGEIDTYITLGSAKLTLAEECLPDGDAAKLYFIVSILIAAVDLSLGCVFVKIVRDILKPMANGSPFGNNISNGLKKLALFSLIGGAVSEMINAAAEVLTYHTYNVQSLFDSTKVVEYGISRTIDGDFLVVAVVLFILSYVFKYGEELQTQVDETL